MSMLLLMLYIDSSFFLTSIFLSIKYKSKVIYQPFKLRAALFNIKLLSLQ